MDTILKISEAANLAIHAMVYVARSGPGINHSVSEIAAAQGGSESHLSKVLQRLVKSGLLASRRGPGGGFFLGREAEQIAMIEILEAIDGPVSDCQCLLGRQKCMFGSCALGTLISHVNSQLHSFLSTRKLADMVDQTAKHRSPKSRAGRRVHHTESPWR
jgi:Rrf2 family protein